MYLFSILTGMKEIYPIALGVSVKNESRETWQWCCEKLRQAMPSISGDINLLEQDDESVDIEPGITSVRETIVGAEDFSLRETLFVSDRDKGLDVALQTVFPRNHSY